MACGQNDSNSPDVIVVEQNDKVDKVVRRQCAYSFAEGCYGCEYTYESGLVIFRCGTQAP